MLLTFPETKPYVTVMKEVEEEKEDENEDGGGAHKECPDPETGRADLKIKECSRGSLKCKIPYPTPPPYSS